MIRAIMLRSINRIMKKRTAYYDRNIASVPRSPAVSRIRGFKTPPPTASCLEGDGLGTVACACEPIPHIHHRHRASRGFAERREEISKRRGKACSFLLLTANSLLTLCVCGEWEYSTNRTRLQRQRVSYGLFQRDTK